MKDIIVFGAGDAAELAEFYFKKSGRRVAAFVVDDLAKAPATLAGRQVMAYSEIAVKRPPSEFDAFVAIGYSQMNRVRRDKFKIFKEQGYTLPNCVSTSAIHNEEVIGENCMIQEGVIIQPFVSIGDNCVFWSGVHVGHHSKIGSHCFFGPRVAVAGHVEIGDECFIGVNATIKNHVKIGHGTLVAAGALVVEDVVPASMIKGRKSDRSELGDPLTRKI